MNTSSNLQLSARQIAFALCAVMATNAVGQEGYSTEELLAGREGKSWRVPVVKSGPTRIPRVCASLRIGYFEGNPDKTVVVHPEIEYWEVRFKGDPAATHVILQFDSFPKTLDEVSPTKQAADGTLTLRCSHGRTTGEKLRFEPQPHKNTIGYWAVATDSVVWPIQISVPGDLNIGLLQGAGDNGGGTAKVSILSGDTVVDSFEYPIEVTGHFQNFRWNHAGEVTIPKAGQYTLKIEASKIDKVALMDVRQVHLSPKR